MPAHHTIALPNYTIIEPLYTGSRTLVYRAIRTADQQPVVVKLLKNEHPSFSELVQFRNQYAITCQLEIPGIVQSYSLEPYRNGYALVMEDCGGTSLRHWLNTHPLTLESFFAIALQLVDILHLLHQQRIIHKDIKPANVLLNPTTQQVKLIDFSIASLLPRETQAIQNPNTLEGTLAYLSPEQTGRMNRGIDYRSDYYALGVTFFELLTGQLPFSSDDPMELVYCHLAQEPPAICDLNPELPLMLGAIIRKLMAKNAEDRYQSAWGLKHDLMQCQEEWFVSRQYTWFDLGQRDISDRFLIPEKLYGRKPEVTALLEAFGRVANGASELMLVAGFSGIGKTAVVNEVHKPIVRWNGYFIKGKYDQFNRNIPFSAFVQAFRDLIEQLLSESDARLEIWKAQILSAVGESGQVMIEVIPELEHILGKQPAAPELSGSAAQNRFNLLFQKFIQVFATPEHPLVMFLDDLQWADSASLNLMQVLLSRDDAGYLLLIGAYRDNEVFPAHPLMLSLGEIAKAAAIVNTLTLNPLSQVDMNDLVAETLSCSLSLAHPLTKLVYQKTQGNPFFATQFLKALHEEGYIAFDPQVGYWQCDLAQVKAQAITDDVVEFMALQLQKLPAQTQNVLKLAACLGAQFDLNLLAIVSQRSPKDAAADLWKALQEGLILPQSEVYKFYQNLSLSKAPMAAPITQDSGQLSGQLSEQLTVIYKFLHDRVQQAAYSLIPDDQKPATHLRIGQLLQQNSSELERAEKLFDVVGHLNQGMEFITQPSDRKALAQLNLKAGAKAKAATAYAAARDYLQTGIALLWSDCWQSQYDLSLNLYTAATEVSYLNSDFAVMEQQAKVVLQQAQTIFDRVKIYEIQIAALAAQSQILAAIAVGRDALSQLGMDFPAATDQAQVSQALQELADRLQGKEIAEMVDLPVMTDRTTIAVMQLLGILFPPVLHGVPGLLPFLSATMVRLSLQFGNTPVSTVGYVIHGMVLCAFLGEVKTGYGFGRLALSLAEQGNAQSVKPITLNLFGAFIQHHQEALLAATPTLKNGYMTGMEVGDFLSSGYSIVACMNTAFFAGVSLDTLESEFAIYRVALAQAKQSSAHTHLGISWQTVKQLKETMSQPDRFRGTAYDETVMLPQHQQNNDFTAIAISYIYKLLLAYYFGNYQSALNYITPVKSDLMAVSGLVFIPIFHFYAALTYLAAFPTQAKSEQTQLFSQAVAHQTILHQWAHNAPMNYLHHWHLVEAEKCRVLGQKAEAMEQYDRAISLAKGNQFINDEALSNELTGKFYWEWGKARIAQDYMIEAYYGYARWGAKAKVADLETRYPQLLSPILQQGRAPLSVNETVFATATVTSSSSSASNVLDSLDLAAVLKVSQSLSSQIEFDQLLSTLLHTVIQTAGADHCVLMLMEEDCLMVHASAALTVSDQIEAQVQSKPQPIQDSHEVPISLINIVRRSLKPTVITNALLHPQFSHDVYIQAQQPKSILCSPILYQGKLMGILYLENNLATGVFTSDRVQLLNLLCAQAAIALENARLYARSQQYAQKLEMTLKDLQTAQLQMVQSEKMSALGNLVAGVAHEINNPVGFIAGNLQPAIDYVNDTFELLDLYQQEYPNPSPVIQWKIAAIDLDYVREDLPKLIGSMQLGVQRIRDISTSLRTFSRADKDYKVPFNIHDGIDSTILILKHRLKSNDARSEIKIVKLYGNLPTVECFPGQLNQVFMNILANAIDALEETMKTQKNPRFSPTIHIRTVLVAAHQVAIQIADNGKGIAEDIRQQVFDHLFTTKAVGEGTGLGLAIARQIVEETHGGQLNCRSEPQKGTEFIIKIPIQ